MWYKRVGAWLENWWAFIDKVNPWIARHWLPLLLIIWLAWLAALVWTLVEEGVL